ncbi:MAG TPA: phosphoethanolamine transferase [Cellvibrionaceae bacterium]
MIKIKFFLAWCVLLCVPVVMACTLNWTLIFFAQVCLISLLSLAATQALLVRFQYFALVMFPFMLWVPIEIGYLLKYRQAASPHIFAILSESNWDEVLGFVNVEQLVIFVIYGAVLIFCLVGSGYRWVHRSRYWVAIAAGTYIGGLTWAQSSLESKVSFELDHFGDHPGEGSVGADRLWASYPASVIVRFLDYLKQQRVIAQSKTQLEHIKSSATKKKSEDKEVYIVVIGESSRRNHWSLYGYEKPTTPLLQNIPNLIAWQDVISVSGATRTSVPVLLGRNTVDEVLKGQLGASWINEFKAQGFKTYWFSNQMEIGTHDTAIGVYAGLVDKKKFINLGYYGVTASYDADLLPLVRNALAEPTAKKLIVVHTLGSHSPYQNRYPIEYDFFKPSVSRDVDSALSNMDKQGPLKNSYDNSIRYTDYVLSTLFTLPELASSYAAVWYVSDHGETFLADGCKTFGHGFTAKYNFQIPALFWYSDSYGALNLDIVNQAKLASALPYSAQQFYDAVLHSAGFDGVDEGLFSIKQEVKSRLIWPTDKSGSIDFDEYFKEKICD